MDRFLECHVALHQGNLERLRALLVADPTLTAARDPDTGATLLHLAAEKGDLPAAELLLRSGADVNARAHGNQTPLHLVALENDIPEVVELLIGHGANLEAVDGDGQTPLMYAAHRGPGAAVVEALLRHGATLDLNSAVFLRGVDFVRERLQAGPGGVRQAPLPEKLLHDAVSKDSLQLVQVFLENGAEATAFFKQLSPLRDAIDVGAGSAIVRLLLEHGADPNAKDWGSRSLLADARTLGRSQEVIDLLVAFGAKD
jgi:ankyrin repeat protein